MSDNNSTSRIGYYIFTIIFSTICTVAALHNVIKKEHARMRATTERTEPGPLWTGNTLPFTFNPTVHKAMPKYESIADLTDVLVIRLRAAQNADERTCLGSWVSVEIQNIAHQGPFHYASYGDVLRARKDDIAELIAAAERAKIPVTTEVTPEVVSQAERYVSYLQQRM